jgi:hypothetical protein
MNFIWLCKHISWPNLKTRINHACQKVCLISEDVLTLVTLSKMCPGQKIWTSCLLKRGGKFKFSAQGLIFGTFCWQWNQSHNDFRDLATFIKRRLSRENYFIRMKLSSSTAHSQYSKSKLYESTKHKSEQAGSSTVCW